jgi:uracil-DNA glycosylase
VKTLSKILFIGEIFGETEEEHNTPFTGSSGIELAHMLRDSGLGPNISLFCNDCNLWGFYPNCEVCKKSLYPSAQDMIRHWKNLKHVLDFEFTNVFNLHPTDNDLGEIFSPEYKSDFMPGLKYHLKRPISYIRPEMRQHLETLWDRVRTTKPNLCILLGNVASWAMLKKTEISKIRGYVTSSPITLSKCLPTFHPRNIMANWPNRPIVLADFSKAKRECEYSEIKTLRRRIVYHATLKEIEDWINLPADRYTVDIESGYALYTSQELKDMSPNMRYAISSQISMVGLARNKTDALVIEFMTRNSPNLSYWQNRDDEIAAWKLLQHALYKPIPKTYQNGIYDLCRMLYFTIKSCNAADDTMLLHHALFPEMLKGLGFLGSIYADTPEWKSIYAKGENLKRDE